MSLFNQFTPVLFYSRTKLICGLVSSNNNADCKIVLDTSYDFKNLEKILTELKTNYGKFNWRILIANNLSYILKQDFLKTEIVSRTEVFQRAVNIIPENLDNDDWDYISLPSQSDGIQQVEIFAPVQEYWQNFKQILKKIEVEVLVVEPESAALARNNNPLIGICLKEDLVGNDSKVLNIRVPRKKSQERLKESLSNQKNRQLIAFASLMGGIFLVTLVIIGVKLNQRSWKSLQSSVAVLPENLTILPSIIPTSQIIKVTPTATYSADLAKYLIQLQPISTKATSAALVKTKLLKIGFKSVAVAAASDSATNIATNPAVLKIKTEIPVLVSDLIKLTLVDQNLKIASLSSLSKVDIVIELIN